MWDAILISPLPRNAWGENDYACNGGESREGRDNNMHKFNRHIPTRHSEHSETQLNLVNEHTEFLKQNE